MAWGAVPLVPVALALGVGIVVGQWRGPAAGGTLPLAVLACLALAAPLVFRRSFARWPAVVSSALLLLAVAALGAWRYQTALAPARADFFVPLLQEDDLLALRVIDVKPGRTNLRLTTYVDALMGDTTRAARPVSGRLLLYLTPDDKAARLRPGSRLVAAGQPTPIPPARNPAAFDFRTYQAQRNVYHQLRLRDPTDWRAVPDDAPDLYAYATELRLRWFQTFQRYLAGDELAVATALVLGDRNLLTRELSSAYADTGAIHVLAVSGLHVGIIYLLVTGFLQGFLRLHRLPGGRLVVILLTTLAIWGFATMSGLSASVQRAAIMFTFLAVGRVWFRTVHVFNVLAAAAVVMLLYDPLQLFHVGFQLSFVAIVGIVAFTSFFDRLVYFRFWPARKLWSAAAASTGAQLGTLPLSLLYFRQFPAYFLLSGTLVVFSAFAVMVAGVLHGIVDSVAYDLGAVTGVLLRYIVLFQNALITLLRDLPGALVPINFVDPLGTLLLATVVTLFAVFVRWRRGWVGWLALGLLVTFGIRALTQVQGKVEKAVLVVYHDYDNLLIDVKDGPRAWSLGNQPAAADLAFTAKPYRADLGFAPSATFPLPLVQDTVLTDRFRLEGRSGFTFGDTRWFFVDPATTATTAQLTDRTHVLVAGKSDPENWPDAVPDGLLLVLHNSVPAYRVPGWRAAAARTGTALYIIADSGAYVHELAAADR